VTEKGWKRARLEDIPSSADIPVPGSTLTKEQEREALRERDPAFIERVQKLTARYPDMHMRWYPVRRHFDITSFGVNACEAPEGEPLTVPHAETQYGQEELYVVLRGRARFICDGEEMELAEGEVLYCRPEVHREAISLETPTRLLIVGGLPGRPYEIPTWSRDWKPQVTTTD
jgi:mannose-6-phosphate isomerase-like protein (cupin superfamily)